MGGGVLRVLKAYKEAEWTANPRHWALRRWGLESWLRNQSARRDPIQSGFARSLWWFQWAVGAGSPPNSGARLASRRRC